MSVSVSVSVGVGMSASVWLWACGCVKMHSEIPEHFKAHICHHPKKHTQMVLLRLQPGVAQVKKSDLSLSV